MSLNSNETSCAMSSQDRERLQKLVDTAMAAAKQEVEADTERLMCDLTALDRILKDEGEKEGFSERCKARGAEAEEELAKVYEKLFVVQERMEKEVGQSLESLRDRERSLTLSANSLLFKIKVQKKAHRMIELFVGDDSEKDEGVESLRLQVARLKKEKKKIKQQAKKEVDSLRDQLKDGKKVIENFHVLLSGLLRQMEEKGVQARLHVWTVLTCVSS